MRDRTVLTATALITAVAGCHRRSLGRFSNIEGRAFDGCISHTMADLDADAETFHCDLYPTDDNDRSGASTLTCPCRGTMAVHRGTGSDDVARIDLTLRNCPHATATARIRLLLDRYLHKADLADFDRDLDRPAGSAADPKYVTTKHVYGDVTVDLNWIRDVYRGSNGEPIVQPTESYLLSIAPSTGADEDRVEISDAPRVTDRPACPDDAAPAPDPVPPALRGGAP